MNGGNHYISLWRFSAGHFATSDRIKHMQLGGIYNAFRFLSHELKHMCNLNRLNTKCSTIKVCSLIMRLHISLNVDNSAEKSYINDLILVNCFSSPERLREWAFLKWFSVSQTINQLNLVHCFPLPDKSYMDASPAFYVAVICLRTSEFLLQYIKCGDALWSNFQWGDQFKFLIVIKERCNWDLGRTGVSRPLQVIGKKGLRANQTYDKQWCWNFSASVPDTFLLL